MAYTASFLIKTTEGNHKKQYIRVTADAASGAVDTGLSVVDFLQHSPQSATTANMGYRVFMNKNSGLTALNGTVAFSGCASGDVLYLTVVGH
ncbi:MAG: hypothetical protein JSV32_00330 [Dehalococcoidia bacterium]|nr:MAG: hypothetical protein JSV32_00330 [Dehalococcoidia bacterium]